MSYGTEREDVFFEERVLKATAALYRVTDFLSESEPMKWKLRKDAVELVDCINEANNKEHDSSKSFEFALSVCRRLVAKIVIAEAGGYIARINFQVLGGEYSHILDTLIEKMSFMSLLRQKDLSEISIRQNYKGHIVNKEFKQDIKKNDTQPISLLTDGLEAELVGKKDADKTSSINERQERITKALQKRGWLRVADVVSLYGAGDVSAKTAQRDLTFLVHQGIVQSRGERRWRKYALREDYKKLDK